METPRRTHYVLLGVAIASVSVSSTLLYMAREAPPLAIAFYRLLLGTLMLAVPAIYVVRTERVPVTAADILRLGGVGFLLAAHFATWITSIFYTSIASSVVIVTTEALWVPLGAHFLLRERIPRQVWWGILIAFAGGVVLVAGDTSNNAPGVNPPLGDFLAFAAALAASGSFLAGRRYQQRMGFLTYSTIVYTWASVFLFAFVIGTDQGIGPFRGDTVLFLFLFALFPMILGHSVINYVLRWVQPHVVSTAILAEPVVSSILALLLFMQSPNALVWIGGGIILAGILFATAFGPREAAVPAPVHPPL